MKKEEIIVAVHTKPDADCFFAVALLKRKYSITNYWFLKDGDEPMPTEIIFKKIRFVDRGRIDLDHHGRQGTTSTLLTAQEVGVASERWMQPILKYIHRADLLGKSWPFDIAELGKVLARTSSLTDYQRMEAGVKMAQAILYFHEKGLKRNNNFVYQIISEFAKRKKLPPRFQQYHRQLSNPRFQRPCDLVEITTALTEIEGEEKTKEFVLELLELLYLDFQRYLIAKKEVKKARKIPVKFQNKMAFIVAGISENPKFNPAARKLGALVVIQRQPTGHTQIFFDANRIRKSEITDNIVAMLRLKEAQKENIPLDRKYTKIRLAAAPQWLGEKEPLRRWYYFVGGNGSVMILNGSLTAPNIQPTKLSLEEIISIVKKCFEG